MSAQHHFSGSYSCTIFQCFIPLEAFVVLARQFAGTGTFKDASDKRWILMLGEVCNQQVCKVSAPVGDSFIALVSAAALVVVHAVLVHFAMMHNGHFDLSHQSAHFRILVWHVAQGSIE